MLHAKMNYVFVTDKTLIYLIRITDGIADYINVFLYYMNIALE